MLLLLFFVVQVTGSTSTGVFGSFCRSRVVLASGVVVVVVGVFVSRVMMNSEFVFVSRV